jgi:hypothetical protein
VTLSSLSAPRMTTLQASSGGGQAVGGKMRGTMRFNPYRRIPQSTIVQWGKRADWKHMSAWEWTKLIALSLLILAMMIVPLAAVIILAK